MNEIRIATTDDAASMLAIYSPFILNSGITQETEIPSVEEFANRITTTLAKRPWLVCEINGEIAGYAYAGKHRDRKGYQWCTEASVYIGEKYYRNNVARALYTALFELLKAQGYINVYAVITLPNDRSVAFHESFGFTYLTTYKNIGYKLGKWHDVGWWQYFINPNSPSPADPLSFNLLETSLIDEVLKRASTMIKT